MIWLLTIVFTIVIIWSSISVIVLTIHTNYNFKITKINLKGNGLLITISQLYWLGIGALIFIGLAALISYIISQTIVCGVKNNDYPGCEVVETNDK